jgi:cytochrome oxidase Cu insertion factor (SCO1/SenC/PrrC family)
VLLVALILVATACGGSSDDTATTEGTSPDATAPASGGAASGTLSGVVREPPPVVSAASLPEVVDVEDGTTEDFSMQASAPGEILLMYFGYTSCPDVCPTTMADVRAALEALGPDADRVSVAMATVDPERDTGEVLDGYLRFFVPENSHILRTEDFDQLHEVESVFGASSRLLPREDGEGYDVEHTGTLYAIDADGELVLEWPFGSVGAEDIASDLQQLLEQEGT